MKTPNIVEQSDLLTQMLNGIGAGNRDQEQHVMMLIYDQMKAIARSQMARESTRHTLQPTALVHEAYVLLINQNRTTWEGRSQFFAFASTAMRRILVNHAVRKKRQKRGGEDVQVELKESQTPARLVSMEELIDIERALCRLEAMDTRSAKVVELRFYTGLGMDEISKILDVSLSSIKRDWAYARAWLSRELGNEAIS